MLPVHVPVPVLPVPRERMLALASRSDVGVVELAAVVETDPALTGAILRAANGATHAPLPPVTSVAEAIARLGAHAAHRVAAVTAAGDGGALARSGIDLDALWEHAMATALLANASAWPNGPRTEAFTAGLLHDAGRLVLAASDPERYRFVIRRALAGEPSHTAERALFETDHVAVARALALACELPVALVDAIAVPDHGGATTLAWITRHSCALADALGFGDGMTHSDPGMTAAADEAIVRSLGGKDGIRHKIDACRPAAPAREPAAPAAHRPARRATRQAVHAA